MAVKIMQAIIAVLAISGCNVAGPTAISTGRVHYNTAIQQTNNEQLLLNLVRLRFLDSPYFLEVAGVSSNIELSAQVSGTLSRPRTPDSPHSLGAEVLAREQPTITYAPLAGEKFASQLMTPLDTNTILLLYHSGWSIKQILMTAVQSMNGLENVPSGPTPAQARQYMPFREAAEVLHLLQDAGALSLGMVLEAEGKSHLELRIAQIAAESPEAQQFKKLLKLNPGRNTFVVTIEAGPGGDHIDLIPRSLMGVLFGLSHAVEISDAQDQAGQVTITRNEDGGRFNWRTITGDLMQVHQSSSRPNAPYVSVRYRDEWFYIRDDDTASKATFVMISQLFALRAGDVRSAVPLLTLPVAR